MIGSIRIKAVKILLPIEMEAKAGAGASPFPNAFLSVDDDKNDDGEELE